MKKTIFFLTVFLSYLSLDASAYKGNIIGPAAISENDTCLSATTLTLGYTCLSFDDITGDMVGASDEGTELPSCAEGPASRALGNFDKWYVITSSATGKMLFQLFTRGFIDEAVFYSGSCSALTEVACFRDFSNPIILQFNPNETYYIRLNKSYQGDDDAFCMQVTEIPANDICMDATPLTVDVQCDGTFLNGDNRSATKEAIIIECSGQPDDSDVDTWYSFEGPFSGRVVIIATPDDPEHGLNYKVYQGTCDTLEEFFCGLGTYNTDSIILVNPGETYFIQTFSSRDTGPFCIWVKEQVSFDNLFYGVGIEHGHSGAPTKLDYAQMEAPTAIELDSTGTCGQTAFARVEPAGVIKLKTVAPYCVEDSETGKEAGAEAFGDWSMSKYRLLGLADGVIPVTFTFEFTGTLDLTPGGPNSAGAQCFFDFSYGFLTGNDYFEDAGGAYISWFGGQEVEYSVNNIAANSGTIDILPKIDDGNQIYELESIIPTFITNYNALPAAEKNDPALVLTEDFLIAINQPIDVIAWDTALQKSLDAEAGNFLAALDYLDFDSQLGYDSSTVSVSNLSYQNLMIYSYQKDLTVLVDNADFSTRPTIWFSGKVRAFNVENPNTVTSDFSNTGRLTKIRVPREFMLNNEVNTLQISSDIAIPIEETECTDGKLLLTELPLDSREFNSIDTITAKSIIEEGKDVVFRSEKIIVLAPGFHAQSGSQFSAAIGEVSDCDAPTLATETEMRTVLPVQAEKEPFKEVLQLMAYPNPFTSTVTIDYYVPISAPVTIKIIDLFGQEKAILIDNSIKEVGKHQLTYRPNNLNNGMYLVILKSGATIKIKKIMLIK